jgi:hypothetical protein
MLAFKLNLELTEFEESCFEFAQIQTFCVPKGVRLFKENYFEKSQIEAIVFERGSQLQRMDESCSSAAKLRSIVIPKNVEVLANSCFAHATGSEFACEEGSRLTRVEGFCFHHSGFQWIQLPHRARVAKSAFEGSVFVQRQRRHISKRRLTIVLRIIYVLIAMVLLALGALLKVALFGEPEELPTDSL